MKMEYDEWEEWQGFKPLEVRLNDERKTELTLRHHIHGE